MFTEIIVGLILAFLATVGLGGCTLGVQIDRIKEGSELQTTYRRDRYLHNEVRSGRVHDTELQERPAADVVWRNYEK